MFNLSEQAKALIEKEIVDLEVRMRLLGHKIDLLDDKIESLNDARGELVDVLKSRAIHEKIDKLHEEQNHIVEELDDLELKQLFYKQEIGWAEKS